MKEPTWHQELGHSYLHKIPFQKNVESSHRLNIKGEVDKYERKKKYIKREMYKFMNGIKKGNKQRHHLNYNLGVLCRMSPSYVNNMSALRAQDGGGTINAHTLELPTGCSISKESNYKKKTSPCRDYENEGDLKKHKLVWNRDGYHKRACQNYLHVFLNNMDLHCSSICDENNYGVRGPAGGMSPSAGFSLLGGKKLHRKVHGNGCKDGVGPHWGEPGAVILPHITSPRKKSKKVELHKWTLQRQNGSGYQRGSSNCSSESTKIIEQFVKSIERNQSGQKEKKEDMDKEKINYATVPSDSNPLNAMNVQNVTILNGYTITAKKSKIHADDQDASTVLLEYKQMVKDNKKMWSLLQRVMYQIQVTNSSVEVNKKIEKGISTYLRKVERIVNKYREALECDDFNKTTRLHRHFRANEMVMLRSVLHYVIDLMRHVKYECKDLRREIEREICEVEEAIWQSLGMSRL
ncbi:hypothetical protein AK88_02950 [Plasmodium fragile]|uniref:Uncharacterized protein n=1 Tax=Plasmodium fragile TaxID=5857 RepID=A0A0D9QKA4_PLAFR|nr:uncharacterized protein AK88_02950 [Plasmodium fragile]KJP87393.1 hypothetical protein AK88_02950 [Plasmodium fragile]